MSGGIASNASLNDGAQFIEDGGVAYDTVLLGGDTRQVISSGGRAERTELALPAEQIVLSGGMAFDTLLTQYGCLRVSSGGSATSVTAQMDSVIFAYGMIDGLNMTGNSYLITDTDATIRNGRHEIGGNFSIVNGTANNVYLSSLEDYSELTVKTGQYSQNTNINTNGEELVYGTAKNGTISDGGVQTVKSGGLTQSVQVDEGGVLYVCSGGKAIDINSDGGTITVENGAILEGLLSLSGDTNITVSGAIANNLEEVSFDVTDRTDYNQAMFSNIAVLQGTDHFTVYTSNRENATYKLAGGAGNFTDTVELGSNMPMGTFTWNGDGYNWLSDNCGLYCTLTINGNGELELKITDDINDMPDIFGFGVDDSDRSVMNIYAPSITPDLESWEMDVNFPSIIQPVDMDYHIHADGTIYELSMGGVLDVGQYAGWGIVGVDLDDDGTLDRIKFANLA